MNAALCQDIERELLNGEDSQRIQDAVLQHEEGEIEIFVRYGRHQKTSPPAVSLIETSNEDGLRIDAYEGMIKTVVKAIGKIDRSIRHGNLIITYKADKDGMIKHLNLLHKDVVLHKGNNTPAEE